jgi:hypothetical protein
MVHALEKTKNLLQPGGWVINMHNLPIPHVIEVHADSDKIMAGWLTDSTDFMNERYALDALTHVVLHGHYMLEDERDFISYLHADDVYELKEYLDEWWEAVIFTETTIQRIENITNRLDRSGHVALRVPTRMTKLRSI